jgi:hypothetical protein
MWEALILFVFWLVQFSIPSIREEMIWVYLIWCGIEVVRLIAARQAPAAWTGAKKTLALRFASPTEG